MYARRSDTLKVLHTFRAEEIHSNNEICHGTKHIGITECVVSVLPLQIGQHYLPILYVTFIPHSVSPGLQ